MIRLDKNDIIVDTFGGDGGDSANRMGLAALFNLRNKRENLSQFEINPGYGTRHPKEAPWNNRKNFTRDQLIPYTAGLWKQRQYDVVRRIFWAHAKRFFLCQNFERDHFGSKKYLWPHEFFKDSIPTTKTVLKKFNWKSFRFEQTYLRGLEGGLHNGKKIKIEEKTADFADLLGPNDIWHLVLAGRMWYFYWAAPLGYLFTWLAILGHCRTNKGDDEGQIIAQAKVAGEWFVKLYVQKRENWKQRLIHYWETYRSMGEFSDAIIENLEKYEADK